MALFHRPEKNLSKTLNTVCKQIKLEEQKKNCA